MVSKKVIAAGVVLIVVLALVAIFVLPLISESPAAVLTVESGTVQVEQSPLRTVTGDVTLKQGDVIKTGPGRASITLFGSSVVRLGENTTLSLEELSAQKGNRNVKIKQDSGRIWNKVLKLSGVDNYQISTPQSVATIRGTAFESWVHDDLTATSTVEGTLNIQSKANGQSVDVPENQAADVAAGAAPVTRALVESDFIRENKQRDQQFLLQLREKIKSKYWIYLQIAKSQYKLTDQQIDEYIDGALTGKYDQGQIDAALKQLGIDIKV